MSLYLPYLLHFDINISQIHLQKEEIWCNQEELQAFVEHQDYTEEFVVLEDLFK